jgi:hypothetical protein
MAVGYIFMRAMKMCGLGDVEKEFAAYPVVKIKMESLGKIGAFGGVGARNNKAPPQA